MNSIRNEHHRASGFSGRELLVRNRSEIYAEFVSEYFTCPICLDVFIQSTSIPCGHKFCRFCIETWFKFKPACPICDTPITSSQRQYADNRAINSVAHRLSQEWQARHHHQIHTQSPVRNSVSVSLFSSWGSTIMSWCRVGMRETKIFWSLMKETGSSLWESSHSITEFICWWIHKNMNLKKVVKLVLMGTFVIVIYCMVFKITNFLQYLFTAIKEYDYDWNIPIARHVGMAKGKLLQSNKNSRFQEFVGPHDTLFAKFIRLFYEEYEDFDWFGVWTKADDTKTKK